MKKALLNLLKYLILPAIGFGIFGFSIIWLLAKPEHRYDSEILDLAKATGESFALCFGIMVYWTISMYKRSQKTYAQLDTWRKGVEETDDILELEKYIYLIQSYRSSMACFGIEHMRYATEIIIIATAKLKMSRKNSEK
jgi:hypothetical protein